MTSWEWGLYAAAILVAVTTLVRVMSAHAVRFRRRLLAEQPPPG